MPSTRQPPNPIYGTVRINGTPVQGAKVWGLHKIQNNIAFKENVSVSYTNGRGEYVLDVSDIVGNLTYGDNDLVRLYVEAEEISTFSDANINLRGINAQQNFHLTRASRLSDGLKGTLDPDGRFGLEKFGRGLKTGLKDALQ